MRILRERRAEGLGRQASSNDQVQRRTLGMCEGRRESERRENRQEDARPNHSLLRCRKWLDR
jgi:hypothetical protein